MRKAIWFAAAAALFVLPSSGWSQQSQSAQGQQPEAASQGQAQNQTPAQGAQDTKAAQTPAISQDPLAAAAKKAREENKNAPKAAKVFTNDNLPTEGGVSFVGQTPAKGEGANGAPGAASGANDEKAWRDKFAKLRHKLEQDQAELDILQREIGVSQVQFYGGNPNQGVQDQEAQQPMGTQYEKTLSEIDAKKSQVAADQQAISDAEDALQKAGGDPGWAR